MRKIASEVVLPNTCAHRMTQRHTLYSYIIHFVQEQYGGHTNRRVQFRKSFKSQRIRADDAMFDDEACFLVNGTATLRAGRSGDQIPVMARFSTPVQTGPVAHAASYTMGTGSLSQGSKWQGRGFTHHPHLAPRLKKE